MLRLVRAATTGPAHASWPRRAPAIHRRRPRPPLRGAAGRRGAARRFGSRLLVVATGQSALQAHPQLQKLLDRFTVQVRSPTPTWSESCARSSCARPAREPEVQDVFDRGQRRDRPATRRHQIGARPADAEALVADYPLLPARRRLWERVLRAIDRAGPAGQLRTQLRMVHDARSRWPTDRSARSSRPTPSTPRNSRACCSRAYCSARSSRRPRARRRYRGGPLRSRLCSLVFLIGQLPTDSGADTGLRATAETLTDLLVRTSTPMAPRRGRAPASRAPGRARRAPQGRWPGRRRIPPADARGERMGRRLPAPPSRRRKRRRRHRQRRTGSCAKRSLTNSRISDLCTAPARDLVAELVRSAPRGPDRHRRSPSGSATTGPSESDVREDAQAAGPEARPSSLPPQEVRRRPRRISGTLPPEVAARGAGDRHCGRHDAERSMEPAATANGRKRRHTVRGGRGARVFQGGGNEVAHGGLREAVQVAAERAVTRHYPEFDLADHDVETCRRPRTRGQRRPLADVGTPASRRTTPHARRSPLRRGRREEGQRRPEGFAAPPYGWPREAIYGILLSLMNADLVGATLYGATTSSKVLDASRIGLSTFKSQSVVLTAPQRIRYPRRHERSRRPCQVQRGEPSRARLPCHPQGARARCRRRRTSTSAASDDAP